MQSENERKLAILEQSVQTQQGRQLRLQRELVDLRQANEQEKQRREEAQNKLTECLASQQRDREQISKAQADLTKVERELAEAVRRESDSKQELQNVQQRDNSQQSQNIETIRKLKEELQVAKQALSESDTQKVQASLQTSNLRTLFNLKDEHLNKAIKSHADAVGQVQQKDRELFAIQSQLETLKYEVERLKQSKGISENSLSQANASIQQGRQENESLRDQLRQVSEQLNRAQADALSRGNELKTSQAIEKDLKNKILEESRIKDSMQTQLNEHVDRSERQTESIKMSEKSITELKKKLAEVFLAKGVVNEEREGLQDQLNESAKHQSGAAIDLQQSPQVLEQIRASQKLISKMQIRLEQSETESRSLASQNKALKLREVGSSRTITTLQDLLKERQEAAAQMHAHSQVFEQSLKECADASVVTRVVQLVQQRETEVAKTSLVSLQFVDGLKKKILQTQQENDDLRKKHDESNVKLGSAAKKLKELAHVATAGGNQAVAAVAHAPHQKQDIEMNQQPSGTLLHDEEIRAWYRDIQESHEKHLEQKLQQIVELNNSLSEARKQTDALNSKLQMAEAQARDVRQVAEVPAPAAHQDTLAKLEKQDNENRQLVSQINELQSQKANLEGELMGANQLVKSRVDEFLRLQKDLREAQQALLTTDQDHVTKVESQQVQLNQVRKDMEQYRDQYQQSRDELLRIQIDNSNLRLLTRQREQELVRVQADFKNQKIETHLKSMNGPRQAPSNSDELEQLLLRQQTEHQQELDVRDQQLAQMQSIFEESQVKQEQSRQAIEARFSKLTAKTAQDARALKERIAELEEENSAIEKRLAEPDNKEDVVISEDLEDDNQAKIGQVRERLAEVEHELEELRLKYEHVCAEKVSNENAFQQDRIVLNKEVESLKEQLSSMSKTTHELERGLEQQRRANLDTVNERKLESDKDESTLILQERAEKAEQEIERMRAEKLQSSENLCLIEKQYSETRLQLGQRQMEIVQLKQESQVKSIESEERRVLQQELQNALNRLKQTEDQLMLVMNEKKQLEERRIDMVDRKSVDDIKAREQKMKEQIGHLRSELNFLREKLKIVEGAFETASTQQEEATDQAADRQGRQRIFQQLVTSLQRAKKTFMLLAQRQSTLENSRLCPGCEKDMVDQEVAASAARESGKKMPELGVKRQRTSSEQPNQN